MNCPICNSKKTKQLIKLDCGNFDNSKLYRYAKVRACKKCGQVYNALTEKEIEGLYDYYNNEYAPLNLSNNIGDMFSFQHYNATFRAIKPYLKRTSKILDVGSNTGGFLNFLRTKGYKNIQGIEMVKHFAEYDKQNKSVVGCIEKTEFADSTFDVIIMDQLLEHIVDPQKAIAEANRILKEGGFLYISVPYAFMYDNFDFFPYYWLLMREHIQHFTNMSLKVLLNSNNFEFSCQCMFGPDTLQLGEQDMPLLNVYGIKKQYVEKSEVDLSQIKSSVLDKYLEESKRKFKEEANRFHQILKQVNKTRTDLGMWGISREALFLYFNTNVKKIKSKLWLLDSYEYKQKNMKIDGRYIESDKLLKSLGNIPIVITSALHSNKMNSKLED